MLERLSVESESMGAQIRREGGAFGLGGLARLVLRPAVERGGAELGVGTMLFLRDGMPRVAPAVVVVDRVGERAVVVGVVVRGGAARQPQADIALAGRIA